METHPFGAHRRTRRVLAVGMLALVSAATCQATDPVADVANPDLFRCMGRNHFSGKVEVPVEKQGDDSTWPYAVFFIDPVQGTSLIVYGPRFRQIGALPAEQILHARRAFGFTSAESIDPLGGISGHIVTLKLTRNAGYGWFRRLTFDLRKVGDSLKRRTHF